MPFPDNVAAGELIESAWGNDVVEALTNIYNQLPSKTKVLTPTTITGGGAIAPGETRKLCDVAVAYPGFTSGVVKFYVEAEASGAAGDGTLRLQIRDGAGTTVLIDGMAGTYFSGRITQHTMYAGLGVSGSAYANVSVYVNNAGVTVNMYGRVYVEIIPA